MIKTIERLEKLAKYARGSKNLADIGTDHAYLPIFLAANSEVENLLLTDIKKGPLFRAKHNVGKYYSEMSKFGRRSYADSSSEPIYFDDLFCKFYFRQGDGLDPIKEGEIDTAIIAGMGGELIVDILSKDIHKTESIGKFILQPRTKSEGLRRWIIDNNYKIVAEDLAREKGKICEIIVMSTKKNDSENSINQLDYLLEQRNPYLRVFLEQKIESEKSVLLNLEKSKSKDEDAVNEVNSRANLASERIEQYSSYLSKLDA